MENVRYSRVLEITSNYVKFAVGYVSKNVPHLLYYKKTPISGLVSDGRIVDHDKLVKVLSEFHSINDSALDLQMEPNAVSLVLPSLGVKVYEDVKASSIVGGEPNAKISPVDVNNVLNLLKTAKIGEGSVLVDVVPSVYVANKNGYAEPPLGVVSKTLSIKAKIYTLPSDILNSFVKVVEDAGFRVLKNSIAVYCASQLIASNPKNPETYILLDIGSDLTTMSLIGKKETYLSRFIKSGGRALSERIARKFNIPFQIANDLKEKFGYDITAHKFETPVFVGVNNDNQKIKIYQRDINEVIKTYYDEFLKALQLSFDQLEFSQGQMYGSYPIIVTGGASRLRGLSTLFASAFGTREVRFFMPNVIGARDAGATNVLGMIIVESKQKKTTGSNDNYQGISSLSRE